MMECKHRFRLAGVAIVAVLLSAVSGHCAEVLTNPSFTGNANNWTLNVAVYDGAVYDGGTAGSVRTETAVGRNNNAAGTVEQSVTSINSTDTVILGFSWRKDYTSGCDLQTITAQIAKPSAPGTFIDVWTHTTIENTGTWTPVSTNISSYCDETGTYIVRFFMDLSNPNVATAQSFARVDTVSLDVTGVGGTPEIEILTVTDGDTDPTAAELTDFGDVNTSGFAVTNTLTITNSGTGDPVSDGDPCSEHHRPYGRLYQRCHRYRNEHRRWSIDDV